MRYFTLVMGLATMVSGCATIDHGPIQKIDLKTKPEGARIMVSGKNVGTTPCEIKLPRILPAKVIIEKDGYAEEQIQLVPRFGFLPSPIQDSEKKEQEQYNKNTKPYKYTYLAVIAYAPLIIIAVPIDLISTTVDLMTTSIFTFVPTGTQNLSISPEEIGAGNLTIGCQLRPKKTYPRN
jgi:hypothetical protein